MTYRERQFADALVRIGAVQFGKFTLASGRVSPCYVDVRRLRSFPSLLKSSARMICMTTRRCGLQRLLRKSLIFDLIADVPTGATPVVTIVSQMSGVPMITPREAKTHGTKATIEGVFKRGQRVLVVDDVMTTGNSILNAIKILETSGLVVAGVLVLIDREEGGKELLAEAGYKLRTVFTLRELLRYYRKMGNISEIDYIMAMRHLSDYNA